MQLPRAQDIWGAKKTKKGAKLIKQVVLEGEKVMIFFMEKISCVKILKKEKLPRRHILMVII